MVIPADSATLILMPSKHSPLQMAPMHSMVSRSRSRRDATGSGTAPISGYSAPNRVPFPAPAPRPHQTRPGASDYNVDRADAVCTGCRL